MRSSDGIMVARGDYGVEAGVARVPLMQKDAIARATHAGKLVITATQMLESMISAPEPTRAEAADVANAVIDGTSAVMLSAETSVGGYPVEAVGAMRTIAQAAEESPVIHGAADPAELFDTTAAVMHAALDLAADTGAVALVVPTQTGHAARACAKYRRPLPIIALASDPRVANQLALDWGVHPTPMNVAVSLDELIESALEHARDFGELPGAGRAHRRAADRHPGGDQPDHPPRDPVRSNDRWPRPRPSPTMPTSTRSSRPSTAPPQARGQRGHLRADG